MTNFYQFRQNNSGGNFQVDHQVCHRLIIEAYSETHAISKAESLGCYWDGVSNGIDCSCCGDRWYPFADVINLDELNVRGWECTVYCKDNIDEASKWSELYGKYPIHTAPIYMSNKWMQMYEGRIKFDTIEQYAEFLATEFGCTNPDVRIFYLDGTVSEF